MAKVDKSKVGVESGERRVAAKVQSFRDLTVWQKSFALVAEIYKLTEQLPKDEIFGLSSQIRRSAVSIPSNIAEGQQRNNTKEYRQFLGVAKGSSAELETQLMLANELYDADTSKVLKELEEIQRMLQSILNKLSTRTSNLSTGAGL